MKLKEKNLKIGRTSSSMACRSTVIIWVLYLLFSVFFLTDAYHSYYVFKIGVEEANPVIAILISKFGLIIGLWGIRVFLLLSLWVFIRKNTYG